MRDVRNALCFILGIVIMLAVELSFAGQVTELWKEEYTQIYFAYIEDGELKPRPGFESILAGHMPRNILKDTVDLDTESDVFKRWMQVQQIRL